MKWEYKSQYWCDYGNPDYLLEILNRLGDEGWEFACLSSSGYTAYFKRPKVDQACCHIVINSHAVGTLDRDAIAKHGEEIADALTEQLHRGHRIVHDIRDVVSNS